jgi:hypothetical protein
MKRAVALLLACALLASPAHADDSNQEAKDLFHGGAQAYAVGQFEQAVKYLDAAYALSPQPAILFSLSQALRRAYAKDNSPATLARALAGFRKYLAEVPQGPRVKDAAAAVTELEMLSRSAGANPAPVEPGSAAAAKAAELIVTSGTKGALIEVDGAGQVGDDGLPTLEFWSGSLEPGPHTIRVHAAGYFDVTRAVRLAAGRPHAIDIVLVAQPALLTVRAPAGTRIQIDGRQAGETPLPSALEVTPGLHVVSLLKNGHVAQTSELTLERGGVASVDRKLVTSTQRKVSYGFLGAGGVSLVASALFFAAAVDREAHANALLDTRRTRALEPGEADDYDGARADRDRYRNASLIWLGAGAGLGAIGALLYLFDQPRGADPRPIRMGIRPHVGPGSLGLSGAF